MTTPAERPPRSVTAAIQDTVHFLDLGVGQTAVRAILLTIAAGVLLLFYGSNYFRGFNQPEAMDQAQLGRNLVRGEGYTTRFIRPVSVWQMEKQSRWKEHMLDRHPDLMNPPLYPALVGGLLYMVQKGDLWPPDAPPPPIKPGEPKTLRQQVIAVLAWDYWPMLWLLVAGGWIFWILVRAYRMRLVRGELSWHTAGVILCLVFFGLFWTPRTVFQVEVEEAFTVYGPDRWIAYGLGVPLTLANGWLIYLISRRLFDRRVGVTAACLFVVSETVCQYAVSGLNVMLVMMWLGLAWLAMVVAQDWRLENRRPVAAVFLGLTAAGLVGLAFLTRYAAGWLLLPLCILGWRMWGWVRGRWMALSMIVVFLMVTGPWLARNYWVSNSFLGLAHYRLCENIAGLRGDTLERSLNPAFGSVNWANLSRKFVANAHEIWMDSPWTVGVGLPMLFFVAAIFHKFRRPPVNRFKWFTIGGAAVMFLVMSAIGVEPRPDRSLVQAGNLMILLSPMVCVFGAAMFFVLMDRLNLYVALWRNAVVTVLFALSGLPLVLQYCGPAVERVPYPPYYPPKIAQAASFLTPKEVMVCDQPWSVAWYGDRRCVWIPVTPEDFYKFNDLYEHVSALMFTPITLNRRFLSDIMMGEWVPWSPILRFLKFPEDFPLKAGRQLEGVNIVIVCDRKRWTD